MDSDAATHISIGIGDLADVQIKRGVHGPLVELRALSNKALAALLVQIKVRVRRLEPASIPSRHGRGSLTRRADALTATSMR